MNERSLQFRALRKENLHDLHRSSYVVSAVTSGELYYAW